MQLLKIFYVRLVAWLCIGWQVSIAQTSPVYSLSGVASHDTAQTSTVVYPDSMLRVWDSLEVSMLRATQTYQQLDRLFGQYFYPFHVSGFGAGRPAG